ncbi:MAG: hypothetical protein HYY99_01825 [Candidatus Colwellbacteria bacterium]|nr:hypothetical protein [Candidatus Colwellbacteria bacterium]MBI3088974.1 hypothetical protein [Candidatus Colwellbacteria bacterium]
MTIIRPNRNEDIRRLITLLSTGLIIVFLTGVFLYMQTVSLKHDLAKKRNTLENLKVENADLKNNFYNTIDANNLEKLAGELGLVQDKNPQWAFASRF